MTEDAASPEEEITTRARTASGAPCDAETLSGAPSSSADAQTTIGRYRLLQKVGEGGMGEVWEAEQQAPVRRRVAVKVIKEGMDTKLVVARFEAERQALALMSHPAVARVFDAGQTPRGRPFFAMEFVKGDSITVYCDRNRLTTQDRMASWASPRWLRNTAAWEGRCRSGRWTRSRATCRRARMSPRWSILAIRAIWGIIATEGGSA